MPAMLWSTAQEQQPGAHVVQQISMPGIACCSLATAACRRHCSTCQQSSLLQSFANSACATAMSNVRHADYQACFE